MRLIELGVLMEQHPLFVDENKNPPCAMSSFSHQIKSNHLLI